MKTFSATLYVPVTVVAPDTETARVLAEEQGAKIEIDFAVEWPQLGMVKVATCDGVVPGVRIHRTTFEGDTDG